VIGGEATPSELSALESRLGAFASCLTPIRISPLTPTQLSGVLTRLSSWLTEQRKVEVTPSAGRLAARLLGRLVRTEEDPGRLVGFLLAITADAQRERRAKVDDADVVAALVRRTGLAPILVDDRLPLQRAELVAKLSERVRGQPEGIRAVADVVATFKAGLNDPGRPLGTLLLAGPTGVGKTATALALAEWAFGAGMSEPPLVRIDMSELQHPAQVHRLIGDTEPGELVKRVREKPFCVVLLDEVEKAHPVFFDLLLGLLDEGRLTDAFGRVTDFRGTIILMTTNLGVKRGQSLGFAGDASGVDLSAIRQFFRPELLNRIDRVVPYRPLSEASIREIAERELAAIATRPGVAARKLRLLFSDAVVARVVAAGFDPLLGARPLQRAVEQLVVAEIARFLLEQPVRDGAELVVDEVDGRIVVA
jgi:ATP-dependent Clp protease ATP-binding subunit ClpA